jgi:hypothetical protein
MTDPSGCKNPFFSTRAPARGEGSIPMAPCAGDAWCSYGSHEQLVSNPSRPNVLGVGPMKILMQRKFPKGHTRPPSDGPEIGRTTDAQPQVPPKFRHLTAVARDMKGVPDFRRASHRRQGREIRRQRGRFWLDKSSRPSNSAARSPRRRPTSSVRSDLPDALRGATLKVPIDRANPLRKGRAIRGGRRDVASIVIGELLKTEEEGCRHDSVTFAQLPS